MKKHKQRPWELIGAHVMLRERVIERLGLSEHFRVNQGQIVDADTGGVKLRYPDGSEIRTRWGNVRFVRPQLAFDFVRPILSTQATD